MNAETVRDFKNDAVQHVSGVMKKTHHYDSLKIKINNLIWEEGRADMTLADAECLACRIFQGLTEIV